MTKCQEIERSIIKKYRKQIWGKFVQAIQEFEMVEENDKIAVCISGGKDSMLLAKCMQELKKHSDTNFDVIYIVMDPGYNEKNRQLIIENSKLMEIPIEVFDSNIFNVVSDIKETSIDTKSSLSGTSFSVKYLTFVLSMQTTLSSVLSFQSN